MALRKCLAIEIKGSEAEDLYQQREESLLLLSKMAELEKISAHKYKECHELLTIAMKEPVKSMQRKYAGLGVLSEDHEP